MAGSIYPQVNLRGVDKQKYLRPGDVFHRVLLSFQEPYSSVFIGEDGAWNAAYHAGLVSSVCSHMKLWEVKISHRKPTKEEKIQLWINGNEQMVSSLSVSLTRLGHKALGVLNNGYVFNAATNKPAEFRRTMNHYINTMESGKIPNELFKLIESFTSPELAVVKSAATWYRLQGIVENGFTINPGFKWKRPPKKTQADK